MIKKLVKQIIILATAALVYSCSSSKHVPQGSYLLDNLNITIDDTSKVEKQDLVNYLTQTPNHKVVGFLKLQLAAYNLSGKDSTKWYNKWIRRIGQPPVIYNQEMTNSSVRQLQQALFNMGYMDATVDVDTLRNDAKRKINLEFKVHPGAPRYIRNVTYEIPDTLIERIVMADTASLNLRTGNLLNRTSLDETRAIITELLRNRGYYTFTKEYIKFYADTAENSYAVDLTLNIRDPRRTNQTALPPIDTALVHQRYKVNQVYFVTDPQPSTNARGAIPANADTVTYRDINVIYGAEHYLLPSALEEKCFIRPGSYYRASSVDRTYEALAQLGIIKTINIEMVPTGTIDGTPYVDAYILLQSNKKQSISFELEGTNSEGDLGFGIGLSHQYRNLGKRSNLLSTKFRMSYESLSGNLSGLINDRYTEFAGETGITFPRFLFPFMPRSFTRRIKASTELAISFNYQERPEYTRIIAGAGWRYKWGDRPGRTRHTFDLLDINYVYLPKSTSDFIDQIAPNNPLLRYSYEDHFIMRLGYNFYRTNKRTPTMGTTRKLAPQRYIYSLRAAGEVAGNLLYAISSLGGQNREGGVYKIFGIQYSQYAKVDFDYSLTRNINPRHSLSFHVGAGIGVPYGNSRVLPFEKRFYAGGANSVRGWSVRTLGPGSYNSQNTVNAFMNQCGDIALDLSAEYRMKLFWVFEGALFVDAGNIWTIHNYENQPGGKFYFDKFWKQIALGYGIGLRLDFDYFLLRFDLGLKAHNPAADQERWPLIHPRWGRDASFHFSVGYPF